MKLKLSVDDSIARFSVTEWDACAGEHPFVRHAFFRMLEESGTLGPMRGVLPKYVGLRDEAGVLVACAPAMLKWSNKREFGPEIRWLQEGEAKGCFLWPKFQVGVPFFPVIGPRLLVSERQDTQAIRSLLVESLHALAATLPELCVLNIMHLISGHALILQQQGWLISHEVRSVWYNPGHTSYGQYLAALPSRKRYMFAKERRKVQQLGLTISVLEGRDLSTDFWADFYAGYEKVCARYGNKPWLPAQVFSLLARYMPESIRVIAAFDGNRFIAGAFCLLDATTLYVQTWSSLHPLPELCFELICYRPVEFAIENGLACVDAGIEGVHKTRRDFAAENVPNAHWFYNDDLKKMAESVMGSDKSCTARKSHD